MKLHKIRVTLLLTVLPVLQLFADPNASSTVPETPTELWGGLQSAIENDALNVQVYETGIVDNTPFGLAHASEVKMIRFDLGTLTGTDEFGALKTVSPKIAAIYARPLDSNGVPLTNVPAIVNIHGGGQTPTWADVDKWAAMGYACIAINWGGNSLNTSMPNGVIMKDGLTMVPQPVGANYDNTDWDGLGAGFLRGYLGVPNATMPWITDYSLDTANPVTDPAWDGVHTWSEEVDGESYADGRYTLYENIAHPLNAAFNLNSYAARRAITFLLQQPEVDTNNIGVTGFSMGGITTTITGTDPRIKVISPGVGGTGWDYEDYYGLPGTSNKAYNGDPSTFSLYQCTVSQESYWPLIQVPSMFVNGTNDFNAPFEAVQRSIDLLPNGVPGLMVNTQHSSHRFDPEDNYSQILWMKQHLKGGFTFPSEPASSLDLNHPCGVPIFSVIPDQSTSSTIHEVEIFYGDHYDHRERYWHKGVAVETSTGRWEAALPVYDTSKPLFAFAKVTYDTGVNETTAVFVDDRYFSLTSEVQYRNAEDNGINELTDAGIVADVSRDRSLTSSDDGLEDWHDYPTGLNNFDYGTFKIHSDHYEGPTGATLQIQFTTDTAGNSVAFTVKNDWGNTVETYRVIKNNLSVGTNTFNLALSDFKRLDNSSISLSSWSDMIILQVQAVSVADPVTYPPRNADGSPSGNNWQGGRPTIPLAQWLGGVYLTNSNEAPFFSADTFIKPVATSGVAYSDTISSGAIDPESQAITYEKVSGPSWLNIASNGALAGTPVSADEGTNRFIVKVEDSSGGTDFAEIEVAVAPVITKVQIYYEDFENSPPGTTPVGTSSFSSAWPGTNLSSSGITLDVTTVNGSYSNSINNLPAANFQGGRYYGGLGISQVASGDTQQVFTNGSIYELNFLHYQPKNTNSGGRAITAELYDVSTNTVYASQTFAAVNNQNVAQKRTLSYTADATADGKNIGIRFIADSVDYGGIPTNFFYGAAIDNIELCADTPASNGGYANWISDALYGVPVADQGFTSDADRDGVPNGVEAFFGTHPAQQSLGACVVLSGSNPMISHPNNSNIPSDVIAEYEWSLNLIDWHSADGVDSSSNGVTMSAVQVPAGSTMYAVGVLSVPQDDVFMRVKVSQN